jgi:serine protease Do
MRKFIAFGPALVVLITALVTLVAAPAAVRLIGYASTDSQIQLARHELEGDNILKQIDKAVRAIADAVEPSVVHIGVEEPTNWGGVQRSAQGSGWVFDTQGHIVTNAHVVRDATRIMVQFNDGRAAEAKVVGQDEGTDVAVLRVSTTEGLFPVRRATGLELHQGDRVYAFGSPFGFKFSMSEGIISGLGRDPRQIMNNREGYTNFIQTDAAVNPGNSGGPLVNVEGKLVGMNVAIATAMTPTVRGERAEGQNSGISFAIPLATIERITDQLITGGTVTRGYLGVNHTGNDELNQQALNELRFRGRGVVVTRVERNGPAARAGLLANDVITKLNDQPVTGVPVLRSAIANNAPGDKINVEVSRNGEVRSFVVELGRLIGEQELQEVMLAAARYGILRVREIADGQVFVTDVRVPSPAYEAGVRPYTRIVDVNGNAVGSGQELFYALATDGLALGHDVTMTVEPKGAKPLKIKVSGQ